MKNLTSEEMAAVICKACDIVNGPENMESLKDQSGECDFYGNANGLFTYLCYELDDDALTNQGHYRADIAASVIDEAIDRLTAIRDELAKAGELQCK